MALINIIILFIVIVIISSKIAPMRNKTNAINKNMPLNRISFSGIFSDL
jgi:hypothetical protein